MLGQSGDSKALKATEGDHMQQQMKLNACARITSYDKRLVNW